MVRPLAKIGLWIIAGAMVLVIAPTWLVDRCYFGPATFTLIFGVLTLLFLAFSPTVLAKIGAVDVLLYFSAPVAERSEKFNGTIIRSYMKFVMFSLCLVVTSMLRQILVVIFMDKDFSYGALVFPLYLIVLRKRIFGGDMEKYLYNYVKLALAVCVPGYLAIATLPMFYNLEMRCRTSNTIDRIERVLARQKVEGQSGQPAR